jgi:hypothetical protein
MCSISIWEPTIPNICFSRKPIAWNLDSCFSHHSRGFFYIFHIHMKPLEIQ